MERLGFTSSITTESTALAPRQLLMPKAPDVYKRQTVDCLDRFSIDYCVESFDPRPLRWLRRHRPSVLRGQLSQDFHRCV